MRCLIALGGNLGDVAETFRAAWERLGRVDGVTAGRLSAFHRTRAVGDAAGSDFLNAAGELETSLAPLALLDVLQGVEREFGRTRDVRRGPRTLDLDLILYAEAVIDTDRLRVPHPACWYRRFVLDPVVEIAPDARHPVHAMTFAALRNRLLPRPLPVALLGEAAAAAPLEPLFPEIRIAGLDDTREHGLRIATTPSAEGEALPPLTAAIPRGTVREIVASVRDVLESAL